MTQARVIEPASVDEVISLAADDDEFYARTFFPDIFRQPSPPFHRQIWMDLRNTDIKQLAIAVFRGGAKTTLLRTFVSKSIAYGISRTIAFIGSSQPNALESCSFIRRYVEAPENGIVKTAWRNTFQLRPGAKWNDDRLDIISDLWGHTISLVPVGITGSIRGLNIDGHRPDLIVLDDVQNEENIGTADQRKKLEDLVFGSVLQTLSPRSESPNSKLVMLQTPMDKSDLISRAESDPSWTFRRYGIFDEAGQSRWPERWSTEELRKEQESYSLRHQSSLFSREKLCVVVPDEGQYFSTQQVRFYDTAPSDLLTVIAIDPVPPPTPAQQEKGMAKKDFEAHAVLGIDKERNVYLLEYRLSKGHQPDWSSTTFIELASKWNPLRSRVEGVGYQGTLKWIIDNKMRESGRFFPIEQAKDQRSKPVRIRQALSRLLADGKFFARASMNEFLTQLAAYPSSSHDDLLDAISMAVTLLLDMTGRVPTNVAVLPAMQPLSDSWRVAP